MAALLPRADDAFSLSVEQGRLVPSIGGVRLPGVTERVQYMEKVCGQQGKKVLRLPVEDFLAGQASSLKQAFKDRQIPIAHTTDLDEGGEMAAKVSFELFDTVLATCSRYVSAALDAGFAEVVVGGDHGFLVRDPEAAPGGIPGVEAAGGGWARGLRYAAGEPSGHPDLAALTPALLGWKGCDVYVPRGAQCLAIQGGAGLFVHGGLSPQESVLVFLRVRRTASSAERPEVGLEAHPKVTSLAFKVTVLVSAVKFPLLAVPRTVKVTVEDAKGTEVWREEVDVKPTSSAQRIPLDVKVKRAGSFSLCVYDVDEPAPFLKRPIKVEVLGDDFEL
jgi:hypothetical protein